MKRTKLGRAGFALPAVIVVMVLLSAMGIAALLMTSNEMKSSRAMREGGKAFYAAEAGLNKTWANWPDSIGGTLEPGDSVTLGWVNLEGGASYNVQLHRVDNGATRPLFRMLAEGRGDGPLGGRTVLSYLMTGGTSALFDLPGAFHFGGAANIGKGGNVTIDGNDNVPPGWGGSCDLPGPAKPGLAVSDSSLINFEDSPTLLGDPPFTEAPFDTLAFDALYDALVAAADISFPPGLQLKDATHQIVPESFGGACDKSVDTNWGAPEDPTHPCFDYYPIVYVPAGFDFKTQPDHAGQGILLVDDATQLENGFSWYGLIMSKGDIQVEQGKSGCEPANVYGSMYTRNPGGSTKLHGGQHWGCPPTSEGSSLFWSSCVMDRIAQFSSASALVAGRMAPVSGSWSQTF